MTAFETFRDELFAQAQIKGFEDYEVYYSASKGFSVRIFQGEIAEYKNSVNEGIGFRGTINGKMGYGSSENLDVSVIGALLDNAIANAGIIEDPEVEKLFGGSETYPEVNNYNAALMDVSADALIGAALAMEKYALELDPRIKMANYCMVGRDASETAIANSHGLNLYQKSNLIFGYVGVLAESNGIMKPGMDIWSGQDFADFDYKAVAQKAVDKAISMLGAESVASGEYPVLFDKDAARSLFATFSGIFMAERGQKGFSMLNKERLGETIAAAHVTIRDDGVTDLSYGSSAFDDEGVATQNKTVIENGILTNLLYNLKSAAKDGTSSTGNASKPGIAGAITTSVCNFYLVPGETSYDDMVSGLEKGVIITNLAGLHAGANPISGDFSLQADGYYVENGKIVKPIEQIVVASNFYDVLKNIDTIGSDLKFNAAFGNVGMPSILVNGVKVSGL